MGRQMHFVVVMLFVASGCTRSDDATIDVADRPTLAASPAPMHNVAIIRQVIEDDGERTGRSIERHEEPSEDGMLRMFHEVPWARPNESPTFSLSRANNENLSIRRPDPDKQTSEILAEWRSLDEDNQFRVLVSGPLKSADAAAGLLSAFYRGEDLMPLVRWRPKGE